MQQLKKLAVTKWSKENDIHKYVPFHGSAGWMERFGTIRFSKPKTLDIMGLFCPQIQALMKWLLTEELQETCANANEPAGNDVEDTPSIPLTAKYEEISTQPSLVQKHKQTDHKCGRAYSAQWHTGLYHLIIEANNMILNHCFWKSCVVFVIEYD